MLPVLVALLGGIIQFGVIFWAQNTLTQVARDTGRWAATQVTSCTASPTASPWSTAQANVLTQAQNSASQSSLIGYPPSVGWNLYAYPMAASTTEGVAVAYTDATSGTPSTDKCPPPDNQQIWFVTVQINHSVPIFFPGLQYLPGLGTCSGGSCNVVLSSTAQFRMEPEP